ncbi:MAG: DUF4105 domain-containing protein [Betaproteobacteria bacterium]|nr:DUF4105 domain-containing protein [Betaproteobacteria bacterium]
MTDSSPRKPWIRRAIFLVAMLIVLGYAGLALTVHPSNDRDWSPDQARPPKAAFDGDTVRISNLRNTFYRSTHDFDVRWEERTYDLRRIESVWFMVEPFSDWRGPAHTLLSFGFGNGEYVAISVEIRKEKGESYSPLLGLLRQYELTYVIGDERDLIGLRANHRHDSVYLYPIRTTPEKMRAMFISMLERANKLIEQPEFYNTLTSTCTTNIVRHINAIAPSRIPLSYKVLLPAFADELAYDLGLIETELPRDQFRSAHLINDLALIHADSAAFSTGIRSRYRLPQSASMASTSPPVSPR